MSPTDKRRWVAPLLIAIAVVTGLVYVAREQPEHAPDAAVEPPADAPGTERPAKSAERNGPVDASAPPAPDVGARPELQAHEIRAEMREAWECYMAPDCSVGEEADPRADYFEAGERVAHGMRALIEQHRSGVVSDAELAAAAREVLTFDSGRARAAAIEALGELPPADEHFEAITDTLDQHHDEKLFELAMPQLARYAEEGRREAVDAFLQTNLRYGAHFPARTIARELGPFLTPENIDEYRALADELPADSRRAALLKQTLEAYKGGR